ncbi:MAG: DUF192 domain-containing protein [Actinobacteria bacterium]|nr:DUF192 domain-containing protein [Actinomycetota bacterium]
MAPRLLIAAAVACCASCDQGALQDGGTWRTTIAGKPFALTVSASDLTRTKGLGGVAEIPADGGMVFVFPAAEMRAFWMVDCIVDMDIVYLDPLGYVTAIHTMRKEPPRRPDEAPYAYEARLPRYSSVLPAQYAIELRAGRAAELGLRPAQKVAIDADALKAALR